ncbi:hypothetical protein A4E12_004946 [Salmonella enterica subsp. enterica]|nr:hypothetical protein [Salmonella enterica subsp. enterica]
MRGRSGHNKAKPQLGRISALVGRESRLRACKQGVGVLCRKPRFFRDQCRRGCHINDRLSDNH